MNSVKKQKKATVDQSNCVACGCCIKVCPMRAIDIMRGIMAHINQNKCIGCGKCEKECPASVITVQEVGA